jgi:hypothetical protein
MKIRIVLAHLELDAELNDTPTAQKVADILPFTSGFNTWGDEIYFPIPVEADLDENAREEVNMGDLGYWPSGNAFCIFFGPTPMSTKGKIIPASAVNLIGRVTDDPTRLKEVMSEKAITLEPAGP